MSLMQKEVARYQEAECAKYHLNQLDAHSAMSFAGPEPHPAASFVRMTPTFYYIYTHTKPAITPFSPRIKRCMMKLPTSL